MNEHSLVVSVQTPSTSIYDLQVLRLKLLLLTLQAQVELAKALLAHAVEASVKDRMQRSVVAIGVDWSKAG